MKILDIPDAELKGVDGIVDGFEITVEELKKSDIELMEYERDNGTKYTRHIMTLDNGKKYSVPKTVMSEFKKAIEKKVKAVEVSRKGEGIHTQYSVTFIK